MVKMCYLCDYKSEKNKPITLHGFPKNPVTREKWLTSCNLTQADNVTHVVICSQHFADEDVVKIDMKVRLKTGAIPSINVPNPINPLKIEEENILDAIPHTNYNFDIEFDESNVCPHVKEEFTIVNEKLDDDSPKKKFHAEPRYVSKISILDFRTPSIASRTLRLIKDAYRKKATQVKTLQKQNQRLRNRINDLEEMIRNWKECDQ